MPTVASRLPNLWGKKLNLNSIDEIGERRNLDLLMLFDDCQGLDNFVSCGISWFSKTFVSYSSCVHFPLGKRGYMVDVVLPNGILTKSQLQGRGFQGRGNINF